MYMCKYTFMYMYIYGYIYICKLVDPHKLISGEASDPTTRRNETFNEDNDVYFNRLQREILKKNISLYTYVKHTS
jgi:hypothetical protein